MNLEQMNPLTLEEAISGIQAQLESDEIAFIRSEGAECLHHSAGRAIRNAWLWDDPKEGRVRPLAEHFRTRFGLGMADDMSGLILAGLTAAVCEKPFDPSEQVARYKEHWEREGVDPLTLDRIHVSGLS